MDEFLTIGSYVPVRDERGARPIFDEHGDRRERECVAHKRLEGLELRVDARATQRTRRHVSSTLEFLQNQSMASVDALSWETSFQSIAKQTVTGVRDTESGRVIEGEHKLKDFFENHIKWEDVGPILSTIRHGLELSDTKKKSWSSLFE